MEITEFRETQSTYNVLQTQDGDRRGLVKTWTKGVPLEQAARDQLARVSMLPFIHKWVAAMPDVHYGKGATVGSVLATKAAIVPAAVGVDIGCGMLAQLTSLRAEDLPDNPDRILEAIEASVPHGRTNRGGPGDRGAWEITPREIEHAWLWEITPDSPTCLLTNYKRIIETSPRVAHWAPLSQLGTLGGGNHFIEVSLDELGRVWFVLHTGSRGPGNRIGMYYIEKAREEMKRWFVHLPDEDLAYLPEGSQYFDEYMRALQWAQRYAAVNRSLILDRVVKAVEPLCPAFKLADSAVNCHHNYVSGEEHYDEHVWVTRKGAVRARLGELGIIPGSMGERTFIVRGLGNRESFESCSHGAGRLMSRTEAMKRFTLNDHAEATQGVACRKDMSVLDETPGAYKPIDAVMAAQRDLVTVVHTLKQVVCVKGGGDE